MRRVVGVINETKQRGLIETLPAIASIPLAQATDDLKRVGRYNKPTESDNTIYVI